MHNGSSPRNRILKRKRERDNEGVKIINKIRTLWPNRGSVEIENKKRKVESSVSFQILLHKW